MAKKKPSRINTQPSATPAEPSSNIKGKDLDTQVRVATIGATVTIIGTLATLIISLLNFWSQQRQFDIAQTAEARRIELTKEAEIRHIGFTHTAEFYAFQLALTQTAVAVQATQSLSSGDEVALVATQTALVADFAVTQTALWADARTTQTAAANAASQTAVPGDTYTPEPTFTFEPSSTPKPRITFTPSATSTKTQVLPSPQPTATIAPVVFRRILLVSATRLAAGKATATLSVEFTGGTGTFIITGDGVTSPQVKNITGTFEEAGVTYNYIHYEVNTTCGSTAPFTVHMQDPAGQIWTFKAAPEIICP